MAAWEGAWASAKHHYRARERVAQYGRDVVLAVLTFLGTLAAGGAIDAHDVVVAAFVAVAAVVVLEGGIFVRHLILAPYRRLAVVDARLREVESPGKAPKDPRTPRLRLLRESGQGLRARVLTAWEPGLAIEVLTWLATAEAYVRENYFTVADYTNAGKMKARNALTLQFIEAGRPDQHREACEAGLVETLTTLMLVELEAEATAVLTTARAEFPLTQSKG